MKLYNLFALILFILFGFDCTAEGKTSHPSCFFTYYSTECVSDEDEGLLCLTLLTQQYIDSLRWDEREKSAKNIAKLEKSIEDAKRQMRWRSWFSLSAWCKWLCR